MKNNLALAMAFAVALILGFTGSSWALPVAHGLADAARYVLETHLVMILDGQSMRFGCF